jgi:hypothetical protein
MNVLDKLQELWSAPPDRSASGRVFPRDSSSKVEEIHGRLLESFSEEQIVNEISEFLSRMTALVGSYKAPSRQERLRCAACLELVSSPRGTRIPLRLVQDIVRSFPITIWSRDVARAIAAYLNREELLEALIAGLTAEDRPEMVQDCLRGVNLYARFARWDGASERLRNLVSQITPIVAKYVRYDDANIARRAARAEKALKEYFT